MGTATATNIRWIQRRALPLLYLLARFYAAWTLLLYGFAKVMGAQFNVLDSQLTKPMGDVSGFWLVWYFFGYSRVYAGLIAWVQIGGALLLCFRRTALAGALSLLPVLVNIVCIDVWVIRFPLGNGALRNALYVLLALLVVLAFHARDLLRLLLKQRDDLRLWRRAPRWGFLLPAFAALGMTAYQAHMAFWIAHTNNRAPTPIDGAWHLVGAQPALPRLPEWIFFEYNLAHMAVFRFADGSSANHDFRVDSTRHTLQIGQNWLELGAGVLRGTWSRDGDVLRVTGQWQNAEPVQLTFQRKPMPVRDHE